MASEHKTILGQYLEKYLKENSMLQKDFALLLGVQPNTLSQWVNGKRQPDSSILIRLAKIFGISVDELLGADTSTTVRPPSEKDIQIALFGGEVSPELWQKAKEYAEFLKKYNQEN